MKKPKFGVGDRVKIYKNPPGAILEYVGTYGIIIRVDRANPYMPYLVDPEIRTSRNGLWFVRGSVKRVKKAGK